MSTSRRSARSPQAYFKCVNDNGGINGRPISYTLYTEQLDAAQNKNLAKKLIESDKVVGVVGNTSLIECAINAKYYKAKGYYVIGAGVPGECFGSPNFAPVNMGPRYSDIGAAQALVRQGAKSLVVSSPSTVAEYSNGGVELVAKAAGIPYKGFGENLPLTDPNSIVQKLIQAAGPGGGVVLNYTPESATPLLKAAAALGVIDKVKWGSSTPAANELVAGENPAFDGKISVNSEFGLLTDKGPDMTLYRDDHGEVREEHPDPELRADGLPRRQVRHEGAAQRQGLASPRSRTTSPCGRSRTRSPTSSASRGTSATRCRTTSRTTRTSPSPTTRAS